MTQEQMTLSYDETRYLRKEVRLLLGLRKSPVPRDMGNGVIIPAKRAIELRELAITFTQKEYS
jgi:hypothetical protein